MEKTPLEFQQKDWQVSTSTLKNFDQMTTCKAVWIPAAAFMYELIALDERVQKAQRGLHTIVNCPYETSPVEGILTFMAHIAASSTRHSLLEHHFSLPGRHPRDRIPRDRKWPA